MISNNKSIKFINFLREVLFMFVLLEFIYFVKLKFSYLKLPNVFGKFCPGVNDNTF